VRYMPPFGAEFHAYRQDARLHGCFAGTSV